MKTVAQKEIIERQSPQFIEQAENGKFLNLIPDTFIIKTQNGAQGYCIRHLNRKDIILIDTTGEGVQQAIKQMVEEGYTIKAILLTHKVTLKNTYASLKTISEDAGGAPIFAHPMNTNGEDFNIKSIIEKDPIFNHFSLSIWDFPGKESEAVVVYSEINNGMIFSGNAALGTSYEESQNTISRPDLGNKNKNYSLAESWNSHPVDFSYFFPYKGKPRFNISEGEKKDIMLKLSNIQ